MTATTTTTQPAILTPARKRLIRQAFARHKGAGDAWLYLRQLPSFQGIELKQVGAWGRAIGVLDSDNRNIAYRPTPATQPITQASAAPAVDEPGTGEWYSVAGIAAGVGVTVGRVLVWQRLGWLADGPLVRAEDIRAFVRAHPLEAVCGLTHSAQGPQEREACWLWLVSVLAGSRAERTA